MYKSPQDTVVNQLVSIFAWKKDRARERYEKLGAFVKERYSIDEFCTLLDNVCMGTVFIVAHEIDNSSSQERIRFLIERYERETYFDTYFKCII